MEDIADQIVKRARMMPEDSGVRLEANGVVIAKVKVTGGVGIEVRSGSATLLFAMTAIKTAVQCFLTAVQAAPDVEHRDRNHPTVRHANGIALHTFEWNDRKDRANAVAFVVDILQIPPLCEETGTVETAVTPMDVRGLVGWD